MLFIYFLSQYIYKSVQGKGRIVSDCLRLLKFAVLMKNEHIRWIWKHLNKFLWCLWLFLEFSIPTLIIRWLAIKEFVFWVIEHVEIMEIGGRGNFWGVRRFQGPLR